MFRNIHRTRTSDVFSTEHQDRDRDSVEDFIDRHRVNGDMSSGSRIHSLMLDSYTGSEKSIKKNGKPNCHYTNETVSKIVKYLKKLDQLAYKHTQQLAKEKQNRELKRFLNFLRHKHLSEATSSASFRNEFWPTSSEPSDTCDYKLLREQYRDLDDSMTQRRERQPPRGRTSRIMSLYKQSSENCYSNTKEVQKPLFESKLFCYPSSSSSYKRITKLQREMGHTNLCSYLSNGATVNVHQGNVSNYPNSRKAEVIRIPSSLKACQQVSLKSKTKLNNTKVPPIVRQRRNNDSNKITFKECNIKKMEKEYPNCLLDIESKIDSLVNSINLLITEIQVKQTAIEDRKASAPNVFTKSANDEIDTLKSDVMGKREELIVSKSFFNITKPILLQTVEEMVKFDRNTVTENILKNKNDKESNTKSEAHLAEKSSVGFTIKAPTSEKAVEANVPIAKTKSKTPAINTEEKSTIASKEDGDNTNRSANTEPLGILSLWRVSTATVRQLLARVPNFDYYSYLPLFQSPGCCDDGDPHYVCNICGADFDKASLLNDHIKGHDLGFARNCCACQRVLNSDGVRREELFRCQFCGQRFTRAYCRELHQQGCAKRLGVPPEVASELILLR